MLKNISDHCGDVRKNIPSSENLFREMKLPFLFDDKKLMVQGPRGSILPSILVMGVSGINKRLGPNARKKDAFSSLLIATSFQVLFPKNMN